MSTIIEELTKLTKDHGGYNPKSIGVFPKGMKMDMLEFIAREWNYPIEELKDCDFVVLTNKRDLTRIEID